MLGKNGKISQSIRQLIYSCGDPDKKEEIVTLHKFLRLYPEEIDGRLESCESPDFIVKTGSTILGIEVCRLISSDDKSNEEWRKVFIAEVQRLYEQLSPNIPIKVTLEFKNNRVSRKDRDKLVRSLVELVRANMPRINSRIKINCNTEKKVNNFVKSIHIDRLYSARTKSIFSTVQWSHTHDTENDIERLVYKKNKKLTAYFDRCHLCWLLIVISDRSPAHFYLPSEGTINGQCRSNFDKIFIFQMRTKKIYELNVVPEIK